MASFFRAVDAEFAKVVSTRLWWVLALILFGYVILGAVGFAFALSFGGEQGAPPFDVAPLVYSMASASGFVFPVIFGALSITGEVRHRTLTPAFLATPHRPLVLGAKAVAGLVFAAGYAVVALVASVGLGGGVLALTGQETQLGESETWAMIARIVLAMAIWGLVGVGLGVLVPSQIGSIVAILAFTQFVEPIARVAGAVVPAIGQVSRFLPGAAGDAIVGASFYAAIGSGSEPLEWWQGALVLAGYAVLFGAIGAATTWRRDVT
jgi:hypothetical protein